MFFLNVLAISDPYLLYCVLYNTIQLRISNSFVLTFCKLNDTQFNTVSFHYTFCYQELIAVYFVLLLLYVVLNFVNTLPSSQWVAFIKNGHKKSIIAKLLHIAMISLMPPLIWQLLDWCYCAINAGLVQLTTTKLDDYFCTTKETYLPYSVAGIRDKYTYTPEKIYIASSWAKYWEKYIRKAELLERK